MVRPLVLLALIAPLAATGCAAAQPDRAEGVSAEPARQPSACDAELRAFVAVSKLARQQGEEWTIFEPAIEALKEQIMDCVQDSYGGAVSI
jgi:hypothetical protein